MVKPIYIDDDDDSTEAVAPCQLLPIDEALRLWTRHYEPLLLCSDEHDAERLMEFEKDVLAYIKKLKEI